MARLKRILPWSLAVVLIAAVGVAAVSSTAFATKTVDVAKVEAKAARFAAHRAVKLERNTDSAFNDLPGTAVFTDSQTGDEYVWDENGQYVRRYARMSGYEGKKGAVNELNKSEILGLATAVATDCYAGGSLDGMQLDYKRVVEAGKTEKRVQATVTFTRYVGKVPTFDEVAVQIDACAGDVMSVEQQTGEITVSAVPDLSASEALDVAAKAVEVPRSCCKASELRIVRDVDGTQYLAWVVSIRTGDAGFGASALAVVDAHTGAVLDSGKSW